MHEELLNTKYHFKIIFVVRDRTITTISSKHAGHVSDYATSREQLAVALKIARNTLRNAQIDSLLLSYEMMNALPDIEFEKLTSFLGVDFKPLQGVKIIDGNYRYIKNGTVHSEYRDLVEIIDGSNRYIKNGTVNFEHKDL